MSDMTKTEAREYLKRCREGIRDAEAALKAGDADDLRDALNEISGSAGTIESCLLDSFGDLIPDGIRGVR